MSKPLPEFPGLLVTKDGHVWLRGQLLARIRDRYKGWECFPYDLTIPGGIKERTKVAVVTRIIDHIRNPRPLTIVPPAQV